MVTKEEFRDRFRLQMAGIALYGLVTEMNGGVIAKTTHALAIPEMVEKVLGVMYDYLAHSVPLVKDAPQPVLPGPTLHKPNKGVA